MEQRVSLITLGVSDLAPRAARSTRRSAGRAATTPTSVVFFQAGGMIVALWSRGQLAEDSGVEDGGGWGGVTLAHNVGSPARGRRGDRGGAARGRADRARAAARPSGAATPASSSTPDGHPWEVAHNPALDARARTARSAVDVAAAQARARRARRPSRALPAAFALRRDDRGRRPSRSAASRRRTSSRS